MTHTTVGTMPHIERRVRERRSLADHPLWRASQGLRISWGGINGGVLVAVGLVLLLSALGLAIGISAIEPSTIDAGTVGTSAAIWAGASLLLALFVGGFAATRLGATTDATTGFFEGALVWVVSVILMTVLAGSGIGLATRGAFGIMSGATETVNTSVGGGTADLSAGDVNAIERRLEDPATVQRAEQVRPEAAAAAWITFGALALSLITAIFGSMVGRRGVSPVPQRAVDDASVNRRTM